MWKKSFSQCCHLKCYLTERGRREDASSCRQEAISIHTDPGMCRLWGMWLSFLCKLFRLSWFFGVVSCIYVYMGFTPISHLMNASFITANLKQWNSMLETLFIIRILSELHISSVSHCIMNMSWIDYTQVFRAGSGWQRCAPKRSVSKTS